MWFCCLVPGTSLTSVLVPAEFKECFSLYDRQRKGKIEAPDLITAMRCLGSSPTPSEVQRHLLSHNIGVSYLEVPFTFVVSSHFSSLN